MKLAENESRFIGTKIEAQVELIPIRHLIGIDTLNVKEYKMADNKKLNIYRKKGNLYFKI